jgi:hypothetical protein
VIQNRSLNSRKFLRHIKQRGQHNVQNNSRRNISNSYTCIRRISRFDEANDEENGSFDVHEKDGSQNEDEEAWHEEDDEEVIYL